MDINNLKEAAVICGKLECIEVAEENIRAMMDKDNWSEDSFNISDTDSEISVDLTDVIGRDVLFCAILRVISDQKEHLEGRVLQLT